MPESSRQAGIRTRLSLLAGLRERTELELVSQRQFRSGVVALRYRPTGVPAPRANGAALKKLAQKWSGEIGLDAEFEADSASLRESS